MGSPDSKCLKTTTHQERNNAKQASSPLSAHVCRQDAGSEENVVRIKQKSHGDHSFFIGVYKIHS